MTYRYQHFNLECKNKPNAFGTIFSPTVSMFLLCLSFELSTFSNYGYGLCEMFCVAVRCALLAYTKKCHNWQLANEPLVEEVRTRNHSQNFSLSNTDSVTTEKEKKNNSELVTYFKPDGIMRSGQELQDLWFGFSTAQQTQRDNWQQLVVSVWDAPTANVQTPLHLCLRPVSTNTWPTVCWAITIIVIIAGPSSWSFVGAFSIVIPLIYVPLPFPPHLQSLPGQGHTHGGGTWQSSGPERCCHDTS